MYYGVLLFHPDLISTTWFTGLLCSLVTRIVKLPREELLQSQDLEYGT